MNTDLVQKVFWCGFNGFGNFDSNETKSTKCSSKLIELKFPNEKLTKFSAVTISWKLTGFAFENELVLHGFIDNKPNQTKKIHTESNIVKICSNDNIILILLCNGKLFQLRLRSLNALEEIKLQNSFPTKRNYFGEVRSETIAIKHVACGYSIDSTPEMIILVSNTNVVYKYSEKIYEFSNSIEIIKIVCGFLHCLILTKTGDVYSFGDGLRGQLGHLEMDCLEVPRLIEALSGVKMIDVAAGGWHSAAISSIGDLYVWGNNCNGQLGLKVYSSETVASEKMIIKKNPTIYPIPQLILFPECCENENCDIIKVECGSRHSIVLKQCGKVFSTGWNLYGQLGITKSSEFTNSHENFYKDEFTEIKLEKCKISNIYCNQWSSIIVTNI